MPLREPEILGTTGSENILVIDMERCTNCGGPLKLTYSDERRGVYKKWMRCLPCKIKFCYIPPASVQKEKLEARTRRRRCKHPKKSQFLTLALAQIYPYRYTDKRGKEKAGRIDASNEVLGNVIGRLEQNKWTITQIARERWASRPQVVKIKRWHEYWKRDENYRERIGIIIKQCEISVL